MSARSMVGWSFAVTAVANALRLKRRRFSREAGPATAIVSAVNRKKVSMDCDQDVTGLTGLREALADGGYPPEPA